MKYLVSGASLGALAIASAAPVAAQDTAPATQERQGGVPRAPWRATGEEGKAHIQKALADAGVIS